MKRRLLAAWDTVFPISMLPDTAATGETFAARRAGECAAINTDITPTKTPLKMPSALNRNVNSLNSPPTIFFRTTHTIHVTAILSAKPKGIAVLHQFRASSRTNCTICFLLAPMQRIMPKNFVRCETLLFIQLEIISTPAVKTKTDTTAASG